MDVSFFGETGKLSLPVVLELLQREDVLVEILLEFLVGVVDVKLLKPVHLHDGREFKRQYRPVAHHSRGR